MFKQVERKNWEEFLIKGHFKVENLPLTEEMEEFIGKSILLRGGRVSDSLSVYSPLHQQNNFHRMSYKKKAGFLNFIPVGEIGFMSYF